MYQTIELTEEAGVATVSLNRPEVRNAFNAEMIRDLTDAFTGLAEREDVRAVVLRGHGPSFSAGADINWMRAGLELSEEENLRDALRMSDMFVAIDSLPRPVVGRVHGATLGGGMGLIAVCDVVVAAEGTVFGFTEARLGILPAVISRFVLPKTGPSWARALFLTAERFGTDVARQIGLVHWVAPEAEIDEIVADKVAALLAGGPAAVSEAKRLIADTASLDDAVSREETARRIARVRAGDEGQEGLRAFLEKRSPSWRGRPD